MRSVCHRRHQSGIIENRPLATPLSVLSKAQGGKDISHSFKRGKLVKLNDGIKNAPLTNINLSRNAIVYVTNVTQGGLPVVVTFDRDAVFDGDKIRAARSIHLQVDTFAVLKSLPDSATVYVKKEELDPVGATNNLRGLAAKIEFLNDKVSQPEVNVKPEGRFSVEDEPDEAYGKRHTNGLTAGHQR